MNIAYISSTSFADSDFPLIRNLVKQGNTVYYFILVNRNGLKSTMIEIDTQFPKLGIFDSSVYGRSIDKYKSYLGLQKIYVINDISTHYSYEQAILEFLIMRKLSLLNPDIVHKIGTPSFFSMIPNAIIRKKLVVTIHDPVPHEDERLFKSRVLKYFGTRTVKNYILLNEKQTDAFFKYYRIPQKVNVYYCHLGIPDILNQYGIVKDKKEDYVLFHGRISEYKGIDILLLAFDKIKRNFPQVKLIIAGRGSFPFDISKYRNDPQIEFINRYISVEETCTLVKNSQFVVCPYKNATQSGVVASVLALGKPLIVTNVGGLPDMIDDCKSGYIIPPNDENSLAKCMEQLLKDKSTLKDMESYISKTFSSGKCSWDNLVVKYLEIYNSIKS